MATPDRMKNVQAIAPDTLLVELASGKSYRVSLAEPMARIDGFAPLHGRAMFATAQVVDHGWAVEWDCGLSMAVSQYSSGARPIPKVVGLALRGIERNSPA